jgi:hypothetical protein
MINALPVPSERQEQMALVRWLNYHIVLRDYFFKNDNEGKRSEISGYNLKMMGLLPGVSDLFIFYPTTSFYGLFLEVKRNKKYTPSERSTKTWIAQEKFIERVKDRGYAGHFCYGWIDGKAIVENYLTT